MNVLSQCGHSSKIPVRDRIADSCSTADGSVVGHCIVGFLVFLSKHDIIGERPNVRGCHLSFSPYMSHRGHFITNQRLSLLLK